MKKEYEEMVNEMTRETPDIEVGLPDSVVVGRMLCKRLDRIADALESIKQSAEALKALSDCISSSQLGDQFRIAGSITGHITVHEPQGKCLNSTANTIKADTQ